MVKVNIIASVFNSDEFLEGYFIDIASQTIFSECALTLVAPNPSEKLKKIVEIYQRKFPNIHMLSLSEDPGISACLNLAIENVDSEYITIANVDDRRRADFLERLSLALDLNPECGVAYAPSFLSQVPNETFILRVSSQLYPCYEVDGLKSLLKHNSPHCCPFWRRSLNEQFGLFDTSLRTAADGDMWMKMAAGGVKFKMVPEPMSIYYFNPNGQSTNSKSAEYRRNEEASVKLRYAHLANE